eukprot:scaffold9676_cov113-Isochrysis_galbana.AAC.9
MHKHCVQLVRHRRPAGARLALPAQIRSGLRFAPRRSAGPVARSVLGPEQASPLGTPVRARQRPHIVGHVDGGGEAEAVVDLEPLAQPEVVPEALELQCEHPRQPAQRQTALGIHLARAPLAKVLVGPAQLLRPEQVLEGGADLKPDRVWRRG